MNRQLPGPPAPQGNIIRTTIARAKLVWRLFRDPRIHWFTKLVPLAGVAYVLFPFDLILDLAPVIGQVDDVGIMLGSLWLFVELCPADIVREHWDALTAVVPADWHEVKQDELPPKGSEDTKTNSS